MTMITASTKQIVDPSERRVHPRIDFGGPVLFVWRNRIFEGVLINYSASGLCIRAHIKVTLGDLITVAPPYEGAASEKCSGVVVWCSSKVFGLEFKAVQTGSDPNACRW